MRDFGVTGKGVTIAFVDTGADPSHPSLAGKLVEFVDLAEPQNTRPTDPDGHGTAVASVALGNPPGVLLDGVAPDARVVAIRYGTPLSIVDSIGYVVGNKDSLGVRVMNVSSGVVGDEGRVITSDGRDCLSAAIDKAADTGIVPVVSAGNLKESEIVLAQFFTQEGTVGTPGAASRAITVGSMAEPGRRNPETGISEGAFALTPFSERGPTVDGRVKPDVVAPGERVTVAVPGGYSEGTGTSFASPFVAGIVALMLEANPDLTPGEVKDILKRTAEDWGPLSEDVDYGAGRVDAYAALRYVTGKQGVLPKMPGHLRASGTLDQVGVMDEYEFEVTDPSLRLGVTLLDPTWKPTAARGTRIEVRLISASGTASEQSSASVRQDTLTVVPDVPGIYRVDVISTDHIEPRTPYFVDVSGGVGGSIRLARRQVPQEPSPPIGLNTYSPSVVSHQYLYNTASSW